MSTRAKENIKKKVLKILMDAKNPNKRSMSEILLRLLKSDPTMNRDTFRSAFLEMYINDDIILLDANVGTGRDTHLSTIWLQYNNKKTQKFQEKRPVEEIEQQIQQELEQFKREQEPQQEQRDNIDPDCRMLKFLLLELEIECDNADTGYDISRVYEFIDKHPDTKMTQLWRVMDTEMYCHLLYFLEYSSKLFNDSQMGLVANDYRYLLNSLKN